MSKTDPPSQSHETRRRITDVMAENMKLDVVDPDALSHRYAKLNGLDYHYLYFEPDGGKWKATIFLFHGYPDISLAWRYQVPVLLKLGLRVICPDLPGFGRTEVPKGLVPYSMKVIAHAMKELAIELGESRIIIGGHDWGSAVVSRIALWQPELVSHVINVCVPYTPPKAEYRSLHGIVKLAPSFQYQVQIVSGEVEHAIRTPEQIRQFLNGMYGGKGPDRERIWVASEGFSFEHLNKIQASPLLTEKEMDYYVQEFSHHGIGPACNFYRMGRINHLDELALSPPMAAPSLKQPTLMFTATYDDAVLPAFAKNMHKDVEHLTIREVATSHWALWEGAKEINDVLEKWITKVVLGGETTLDAPGVSKL